jgi:flagellin-like hook-associated protein FlgL
VAVDKEMTELAKNEVLTQVATSMLSQANSLPKMVMQIIQGS